jgi:hypothetical protein
MSSFSKLQRNFAYKNYLIEGLFAFVVVLLSSSFIYFPLMIGFLAFSKMNRVIFYLFLFFTEVTHNFPFLSLLFFYLIFNTYVYPFFRSKIDTHYLNFVAIFSFYFFYFVMIDSYYILEEIPFDFNYFYIFYYVLVESFLNYYKEL